MATLYLATKNSCYVVKMFFSDMKNIVIFCIFICMSFNVVLADVIDNMLLESLYESKREAQENKENELKKTESKDSEKSKDFNKADSSKTKQTETKESKSQESSSKKYGSTETNPKTSQTQEKREQSPLKSRNEEQNNDLQKIIWFVGVGGETQTPKTKSDGGSFINMGLQFGAFKYFTKEHLFRFSLIANYNALANQDFYSVGGAIDYFYSKAIQGRTLNSFGVFAGSAISMPIASIYKMPNVTIRMGAFATMANLHLEVYIGYPFYQDPKLNNILSAGVNIHYFFNMK